MTRPSSSTVARGWWFVDHLECPDCGGTLSEVPGQGIHCEGCAREFAAAGRAIRCFPTSDRVIPLSVPPGLHAPTWPAWTPPPHSYDGPLSAWTNARHLSILADRPGRLDVLDLGCGAAEYRAPVQRLGHRYLGFDAEADGADVLGDAHRLPLRSASFDHVLTNAVLEHVANPVLAVREVARVLRPGGVFSGSVAFLEPHHAGSYFHMTADGVAYVLASAGFHIVALWPQERWMVFESLATMPGPLSGLSRRLLRVIASWERFVRARHLHPRALRQGRWLRRRRQEELWRELLTLTGQVDFHACRPASLPGPVASEPGAPGVSRSPVHAGERRPG